MPGMYEILSGQISVSQLRNVDIEDLLRREPICINAQDVEKCSPASVCWSPAPAARSVRNWCRQMARWSPDHLILLGHGENSLFLIEQELRHRWPKLSLGVVVADIRDLPRLTAIFAQTKPQVVFHAPRTNMYMMEANCEDAISNNVGGTRSLVQLAERFGIERFVLISSDKAVNPTNVWVRPSACGKNRAGRGATNGPSVCCRAVWQCAGQSGQCGADLPGTDCAGRSGDRDAS